MDVDLFARVAVSDPQLAISWFDRFFGEVESFEPNDTERVWTVSEHRHDPDGNEVAVGGAPIGSKPGPVAIR